MDDTVIVYNIILYIKYISSTLNKAFFLFIYLVIRQNTHRFCGGWAIGFLTALLTNSLTILGFREYLLNYFCFIKMLKILK